ncbi:MAG: ATP-binding protein [Bacteroidota bacterium]|nr:ATP-binding protein [Bacteroidota bacterium]
MTIAVASGKGGAGKTMIATALTALLAERGAVTLLDCDVEEPNAHLFFDLPLQASETVWSMVPVFDERRCTHCGVCQRVCAFHALLCLKDTMMLFPELCKGCRGCVLLCPEAAAMDGHRAVGIVETRQEAGLCLFTGRLHVGDTAAPAVIREVKKCRTRDEETRILDAPPGTACAAVESVRAADYTILVAEATPFGLHDAEALAAVLRDLQQPFGVVINKSMEGDHTVRDYCARQGIPVIGEIPLREDMAHTCARGAVLPVALPDSRRFFDHILSALPLEKEMAA